MKSMVEFLPRRPCLVAGGNGTILDVPLEAEINRNDATREYYDAFVRITRKQGLPSGVTIRGDEFNFAQQLQTALMRYRLQSLVHSQF